MKKKLFWVLFSVFGMGHSIILNAQTISPEKDSLQVQKPVQVWTEADGKDSIQSPDFIQKNGLIIQEPNAGNNSLKENELMLIAPDRRNQFLITPKKD